MTKKWEYQMAKGLRRKPKIEAFVRHTCIYIEHSYSCGQACFCILGWTSNYPNVVYGCVGHERLGD